MMIVEMLLLRVVIVVKITVVAVWLDGFRDWSLFTRWRE